MAKIEGKVANRYARALLDSVSLNSLDALRERLALVSSLWLENSSLQVACLNPAIPEKARQAIVADLAEKIAPKVKAFVNFLSLLLENKRLSLLPAISETFARLVDELKKQMAVEITSAFQISDLERSALEGKVKDQFGALAQISWQVDPDILGGLVVRSGDKLLDSSVRGALSQIQTQLEF